MRSAGRMALIVALALAGILVVLPALVFLLIIGVIGLPLFIVLVVFSIILMTVLAVLSIPLFMAVMLIPASIIIIVLFLANIVLASVITVITLWMANSAFQEAVGVSLLPIKTEEGIVWWRLAVAVILFTSIYILLSRVGAGWKSGERRSQGVYV